MPILIASVLVRMRLTLEERAPSLSRDGESTSPPPGASQVSS
jgi:hypothetical protein